MKKFVVLFTVVSLVAFNSCKEPEPEPEPVHDKNTIQGVIKSYDKEDDHTYISEGAEVYLHLEAGEGKQVTVTTNEKGEYKIENIKDGVYQISAIYKRLIEGSGETVTYTGRSGDITLTGEDVVEENLTLKE